MRSLDSLVRLHRWKVDELRRETATLERLAADLAAQADALAAEVAHEQEVAAADQAVGLAYGPYAAVAVERRRRIESSRAEVAARIATLRETLRSAFIELKRHEQLRDQRLERQRLQRERKAAALLDEISLDLHRRRAG